MVIGEISGVVKKQIGTQEYYDLNRIQDIGLSLYKRVR